MAKPMTKTEWLNWLEKAWDDAQQAAWAEKPKMRRTTRDEKIVNPGVYEVPVHASDISQEPVDETVKGKHEWVKLTDEEIYDYADKFLYQHGSNYGIKSFGKAIEAKLKEKNGG